MKFIVSSVVIIMCYLIQPGITLARSQSSNTMAAFFPPSLEDRSHEIIWSTKKQKVLPTSKESFLKYGALFSMIYCPVAVEPVKETIGTSGCWTSAAPHFGPNPNTILTTPGGRP